MRVRIPDSHEVDEDLPPKCGKVINTEIKDGVRITEDESGYSYEWPPRFTTDVRFRPTDHVYYDSNPFRDPGDHCQGFGYKKGEGIHIRPSRRNEDSYGGTLPSSGASMPSVPARPTNHAISSFPSGIFGPGFPFSTSGGDNPYFPNGMLAPGSFGLFESFGAESGDQLPGDADDASTLRPSPSSVSSETTPGISHSYVPEDLQPRPYAGIHTAPGLRRTQANAPGDGTAHTSRARPEASRLGGRGLLRNVYVVGNSGGRDATVIDTPFASHPSHGSTAESAPAGNRPSEVFVSVQRGQGSRSVVIRSSGDRDVIIAGNGPLQVDRLSGDFEDGDSQGGSFWSTIFRRRS